jgi:hypothetical protein
MASYSFVPSKLTRKKRAIIGGLHVLAHLTAALLLMLLMELGIEVCIRNHLLATSGMLSHIVLLTTMLRLKFLLSVKIEHALVVISLLKCKRYLMQSFELGVCSFYDFKLDKIVKIEYNILQSIKLV